MDYIVCAHKAIDQDQVAVELGPVVTEKSTIVIIQNGVGNEEPFRKQFPDASILTCVVRENQLFCHWARLLTDLTSEDMGWSDSDQPRNCEAYEIGGHADRPLSQPQSRRCDRTTAPPKIRGPTRARKDEVSGSRGHAMPAMGEGCLECGLELSHRVDHGRHSNLAAFLA